MLHERYLPPSDPYAFLIEAEKLTPEERRWQARARGERRGMLGLNLHGFLLNSYANRG